MPVPVTCVSCQLHVHIGVLQQLHAHSHTASLGTHMQLQLQSHALSSNWHKGLMPLAMHEHVEVAP